MAFFGNPRFLGIDFGTASLKAVELELVGDKPVLVNYGVADFSHLEEELKEANYTYDEAVALYLHALLAKMNPKTNQAHIAMPAYTGLIALVDFPSMSEAQMSEAVRFEAHKYVPMALDDVALVQERLRRPQQPRRSLFLGHQFGVAAFRAAVERVGCRPRAHQAQGFVECLAVDVVEPRL